METVLVLFDTTNPEHDEDLWLSVHEIPIKEVSLANKSKCGEFQFVELSDKAVSNLPKYKLVNEFKVSIDSTRIKHIPDTHHAPALASNYFIGKLCQGLGAIGVYYPPYEFEPMSKA